MRDILFVKFSNERNKKYRIKTMILSQDGARSVEKTALNEAAKCHILNMLTSYNELLNCYNSKQLLLNKCSIKDDKAIFEYINGETLAKKLDALIVSKKIGEAISQILKYFDVVTDVKPIVPFKKSTDFTAVFGDVDLSSGYECCSISNIDIVFDNVIINDFYNLLDYEWTFDFPVPIKFLKYRAISNFICSNVERNAIVEGGIFEKLDISQAEIEIFNKMEINFQGYVSKDSFVSRKIYNTIGTKNFDVRNMVAFEEVYENKYDVDIYCGRGSDFEYLTTIKNANTKTKGCIGFDVPKGIDKLRIDPLTATCIMNDLDITCFKDTAKYTPSFITNGYRYSDKGYIFGEEDTQFVIDIEPETTSIVLSYDFSLAESNSIKGIIDEIESTKLKNRDLEVYLNERQGVIEALNDNIREYAKQVADHLAAEQDMLAQIEFQGSEISNMKSVIDSKAEYIARCDNQILSLNNALQNREREIEEIYNSTCWKITAPLRSIVGGTKKFFRNNPVTQKPYELLYYIKKDGLKTALKMRKSADVPKISAIQSNLDCVYKADIVPVGAFDKKIAVHLHLYYVDLLQEFFNYFNNIPYKFDLYVSCKAGSDLAGITKQFKKLKKVEKVDVRETINRGRDIAPLYVQFAPEISNYDYFLHVHSKKSLFTGKEQYGWRQFSLDCLLKDEKTIQNIFSLFEGDKKIGLFYPETFGEMHLIAQDWLANAYNGKKLLNELGIEFEEGFFNYPVGSFFWAKMDAVKPLFDRKLKYEDFPEEAGQTDGTLAHALERAIAFVVNSRGYQSAIHDISAEYILLGKSYKVYQDYFKLDYEAVQYHLSQFDLVSFDIFDTLITRCIYNPDDIFKIMGANIEKEFGIKCDYLSCRKKAEALAWEAKKEYTSIHDIYSRLAEVMNISKEVCEKIKAMEIDLEYKLCIPRYDMLKVFEHIKACGKKIVLVSDMYLTSDIIEKMLTKCGFTGYEEIWVSCERGARKDNDTIWESFFNKYGDLNTIHVGDNPRSDIQLVGDKLRRTFFVMNPRTGFKMSKYYNKFRPYIKGSVMDSVVLGMFINGGVFNSPFAQGLDGEPIIDDYQTMGYSTFGGLFSAFSIWLNSSTKKDDILLFLAREGYIFESVYKNVYSDLDSQRRNSCYFLTSRRAISVSAIFDEEDLRGILAQFYRGSFENLLKSRLGFTLFADIENREIAMPEDLEQVMQSLEPHFDEIFDRAKEERQNYSEYITSLNLGDRGIVVDVGYSGTIQYYMAKLLKNKQAGLYLCTWVDKKPDKLNCRCEAMYPVLAADDEKTHKIFKNQLFLEAVLKAPFGQLICFEKTNDTITPIYKDDRQISESLKSLQQGIIDYSKEFGSILAMVSEESDISSELVCDIFDTCLEGGWISDKVAEIMTVQDDYCKNGSHRFNAKTKTWDIIQE